MKSAVTALVMLFRSCHQVALLARGIKALPFQEQVFMEEQVRETDFTLRFEQDGTFQIAIMSDLHTGEAEDRWWGPAQDASTLQVINNVLENESPQLVILNGDLITGENTFRENSSHYIDLIVEPLVARGLPWASSYGNHDSNFNLSREDIFAREHMWPNSLTRNMVPGKDVGVTNYYLPVYSSEPLNLDPEVILWFFDSRGGNYYQQTDEAGDDVPQPEWVHPSVATWMGDISKQLQNRYGKTIPSLAFYHIPVKAMAAFQVEYGVNPKSEPGINDDNPLATQGTVDEVYLGKDVPFEKALLQIPGLMAAFSGHDHGNDWCFKWNSTLPTMEFAGNGIDLCFGRHTGYGGYGNWMRGSRQIKLNITTLGEQTETWVRLEDSTESGRIVLNSSYGLDKYPLVEDKRTSLPKE